jgi:CelD/BcsL family acetyltransferase involved in cellulose biosynthesis
VRDQIEPLEAEWERLADRLGAPPFLRPGWFAAFWRSFGDGELIVLTSRRSGRLSGVLPLAKRHRTLSAPANYHSPLFAPLTEDAAVASELAEAALAFRPRRLSLPFTPDGDLSVAQLEAALAAAGRRLLRRVQQRTPVLDLSAHGDWASFEASLSRDMRQGIRRRGRQLEAVGTVRLDVVTASEGLEGRLAEVFRVEGLGWKADRGTAILSLPETRRFYDAVAHWAAGQDSLRLYLLRLDDAPIAVNLAVEDRGVRYMLKGGYDPAYHRHSVGTLLLARSIEEAFARGLRRVEFGGGDDPYKLRWTLSVQQRVLVQAFSRSPLGQADRAVTGLAHPATRRLLGLGSSAR